MSPYGDGSIYQRHFKTCPPPDPDTGKRAKHTCAGRWVGTLEAGWTSGGGRRRVTVTAKTEAEVRRKLRDKKAALKKGRITADRMTVKTWAGTYLEVRVRDLSPKGYNAAANPIKNWVIPTIGHRRLDQLTPTDIRAVHNACRDANRQAADVHRVLRTMLNAAVAEGHTIAPRVLAVKAPKPEKSDRAAMTIPEGVACLEVASTLPHGTRWAFTLLSGARLGECLGMTWDMVDLDAGEAIIEWQLQALPYNKARDRSSGFRVPDGYEARHLVDAFHLVRPKSRKGYRVAPLLPAVVDGLRRWQQVAPANPWGLVWPNLKGRPANDKHDRAEWWALQETAGVHHPTRLHEDENTGEMIPAPFHVHETRNFAATMLLEADVPEHVVADLLGHSTVATSLRYRTARREPLRDAMERAFAPMQLG